MRYKSGEAVQVNDRVLLWGNQARVEFVVYDEHSPEGGYYFKKHGRGVMFHGENIGNYYCDEEALPNEEDVVFIGRGTPPGTP